MNWLPEHEAGLSIEHNDHKNIYQSAEDYYEFLSSSEWVSLDEKKKAFETDSVWVLTWYPNTPVGFCQLAASSLEAIQKYFEERKRKNKSC